jgi:hypothetical protein
MVLPTKPQGHDIDDRHAQKGALIGIEDTRAIPGRKVWAWNEHSDVYVSQVWEG